MDKGRYRNLSRVAGPGAFHLQRPMSQLVLPTFGIIVAAGALVLLFRHAHHLFGDAVGFLLIFVSRLVYSQFPLDHRCGRRMYGNLANTVPKVRQRPAGQAGIWFFRISLQRP